MTDTMVSIETQPIPVTTTTFVRVRPERGVFVVLVGPEGWECRVAESASPDVAMRAARQLVAVINHAISSLPSVGEPVMEPAR
jgi:hypothetical protein